MKISTLVRMLILTFVAYLATSAAPENAKAWGPLGHRIIAESATLLLEKLDREKLHGKPLQSPPDWGGWGAFLTRHRFELGYYSIIPDSHYRMNDGGNGKTEAPCHFFDADLAFAGPFNAERWPALQKELDAFPATFAPAQTFLQKRLSQEKGTRTTIAPLAVGTAPWRTEQMMDRVWSRLKSVKSGAGTYQEGRKSKGDAKAIYESLTDLGVLSHYTGDAAMPHHATLDYNGFEVGHGGIHFYFENDCVNVNEPGLSEKVLLIARKEASTWLKRWRANELRPSQIVLEMFLDSAVTIDEVIRLDNKVAIIKKSTPGKKGEDALRKDSYLGCKGMRDLVATRLAKATVLTAFFWKWVLPDGVDFNGSTQLKFSDFEFNTDYIKPEYEASSFLQDRPPGAQRTL